MRIVHLADSEYQVVAKKTAKQERIERCVLMLKNQRSEDRIRAKKMMEKRVEAIKNALKP